MTLPNTTLISIALLLGTVSAPGVSVEVEYRDEYHQVLDVKRNNPIIEVEGKRRSVNTNEIRINRDHGTVFQEGYFNLKDREINTKSLSPKGGARYRNLTFRAELKSSVDLENNFIVLSLGANSKQPKLILAELPDLKANTWTKVSFKVPLNKALGTARARHFIFSNGSQVLREREFNQLKRRKFR